MLFPNGFVWGAAAASYQIEGAAFEGGKGLSVWDMFCRKPGAVWSGDTGNVAADHYHRYAEDVKLMQQLGLNGYRLSISWPRVIPAGDGPVNEEGLNFYDRLIDELLGAGITPFVTLFHWDYPYDLYCRGGWLNPASPDWFANYASVVTERLGDRVHYWMTQNEQQCFIGLGHQSGAQAPGDRLGLAEILRASHHALLAHGKAVQAIRAASTTQAQVGMAPVGVLYYPASGSPADIDAARAATFSISSTNPWNNTWWMDPVFFGHYPEDGMALFGKAVPQIRPGDMETISQPLDFFGANIYHGTRVHAGESGKAVPTPHAIGPNLTGTRWYVEPEALYWGPRFFYERYKLPIYITENGLSNLDWVAMDGKVHDPQRIDFTRRYLHQLGKAAQEGIDVRGYFHWSIMDNFEWAEGYKERFGLVYVDFNTQQRIPKDSYDWYRKVIATNGQYLEQDPFSI